MLNSLSKPAILCIAILLTLTSTSTVFAGKVKHKVVHTCIEKNTQKTFLSKGPLKLILRCVDEGVETRPDIIAESSRGNTRFSNLKSEVFFDGHGGPGVLYESGAFASDGMLCKVIGDRHSSAEFTQFGTSHALVSDNGRGLSLDNGTVICVNTPGCDCEITGIGITYHFEPKGTTD